jgi:hypothetical protein
MTTLLLLINPLDFDYIIWAQQETASGQESSENIADDTANRLDTIIELLDKGSKEASFSYT